MGTNYIAPTWRQPENLNKNKLSNYSIDTSGTSVGINCGSMADLFGTASVTYNTSYSIWIKPEFNYNDSTYQTFFGNYASGNNAVLLYYQIADDRWRFLVGDGAGFQFVSSAQITSNEELGKGEWQHHCVVFDTVNNNAYYYINNQQINSSTSITKKIATAGDFYIGKKWDLSTGTFTGQISQGCIFDYALSTEQRTYLYNLNNPMAITGAKPIAYWPLGDNSNLIATAGYPNISVGADSVFDFDSSGQRIDLGLESNFNLGGGSKSSTSLWFKKVDNGSSCLYGYNYGDANGSGYYFWLNSGALRIAVGKDGATSGFGFYQINSINLPIGEWINIVVVFDGTLASGDDRIKVYQNGEVATGSYTNGTNFPATLPTGNGASNRNVYLGQLQLGNGSFSYNYDGEMSNVQQWDTDLDLSDSIVIYNNGQPLMTGTQPEEANLKAWYKLNQTANWTGSAWSIPDDSTNTNTATSIFMNTTNLVQSNLTRTQPFSDYSMFYDAVDVYSTFDTQISLGSSDSFTWSFWIKPVYNSISDMVLVRASATSITANNTMLLTYSGGNWRIKWDNASGNFQTGYVMPNNEWSHVALSITQGTGTRYAYINGVEVTSNPAVTGITSQWLGFSSENNTNDFEGYLSQCAYWDTNLSTTELAALYNNGVPQDLRDFSVQPTQYWPMNQDYSYWNGSVWINRDIISGNDSTTVNTAVISAFVGNAPGSKANGTGTNLTIADLKGDMKNSINNSYSINMADYADGVTNPADSGRSTNVP